MTDHERELLKWVAEELLGWQKVLSPSKMAGTERWMVSLLDHPARWYEIEEMLESWHGIGLVVEAMEKRDLYLEIDSGAKPGDLAAVNYRAAFWNAEMKTMMDITVWGPWDDLNDEGMYVMSDKPWFAVYGAARKAVTND